MKARQDAGEYMLRRPCRSCTQRPASEVNLAAGWTFESEKTVVSGTRSDVVFTHSAGDMVVVEVVNTHEMEPETRQAYKTAGYKVGVVWVAWDSVARLLEGLQVGAGSLGFPDRCDDCDRAWREKHARIFERAQQERQAQVERQARLDQRKHTVDAVLSRITRRPSLKTLFQPWYFGKPRMHSSDPTPMYSSVQRRVFANAVILSECGFEQHNTKKPWLFRYTIHRGRNVMLYADLGGSDVVPIYEDTAAMLYVFGDDDEDEDEDGHSPIRQYIIEEAARLLQKMSVEVRTGFQSAEQIERQAVSPLSVVPPHILDPLIRQIGSV